MTLLPRTRRALATPLLTGIAQTSAMELDTVQVCDALSYLRALPSNYVNCIVTSPPYWSLRDYGVAGQIGLEETLEEYIERMVVLFREARRVLREDGNAWCNMGDKYVDKQLQGLPWKLAFALQEDGWLLRSDIVWSKPSPMPESVTDRPTKAHEYLFLLTKSARYFYDADAIREATRPESFERAKRAVSNHHKNMDIPGQTRHSMHEARANGEGYPMPPMRNKRTVWTIATEPFPDAHFATFPTKLVEPPVLAGCPHKVCVECGAPWERVVERKGLDGQKPVDAPSDYKNLRDKGEKVKTGYGYGSSSSIGGGHKRQEWLNNHPKVTLGFQPTCSCNADTRPGIVLDMFLGSGTTALVARELGRHYIGCDLSPEYVNMARERLAKPYTLPMMELLA